MRSADILRGRLALNTSKSRRRIEIVYKTGTQGRSSFEEEFLVHRDVPSDDISSAKHSQGSVLGRGRMARSRPSLVIAQACHFWNPKPGYYTLLSFHVEFPLSEAPSHKLFHCIRGTRTGTRSKVYTTHVCAAARNGSPVEPVECVGSRLKRKNAVIQGFRVRQASVDWPAGGATQSRLIASQFAPQRATHSLALFSRSRLCSHEPHRRQPRAVHGVAREMSVNTAWLRASSDGPC
ncbi:hypothetical protein MRX96_055048 [Rhipicephalus microplus]